MPNGLKFPKTKIITALSALNAIGLMDDAANLHDVTFYIEFGAGTASGGVTIESAAQPGYAGTWVAESVVAWAAASKTHVVRLVGVSGALRARISTVIGSGTVDVWAMGQ